MLVRNVFRCEVTRSMHVGTFELMRVPCAGTGHSSGQWW